MIMKARRFSGSCSVAHQAPSSATARIASMNRVRRSELIAVLFWICLASVPLRPVGAQSVVETVGSNQPKQATAWGETIRGAKVGLSAPTFLRVGQPFEVIARSKNPFTPTFMMFHDGANGPVLEVTDAQGKVIACKQDAVS